MTAVIIKPLITKLVSFVVMLSFSISIHSENITTDPSTQQRFKFNHEKNESHLMIDFNEKQDVNKWRITNDDVMGGRSKGDMLVEDEHGVFSGDISLANNGGFSSVFRAVKPLCKDFESVIIDIKGDGQIYQLRMVVYVDGYRLAYKQDFNTIDGQREKLKFTLSNFQATFRGRMVKNAPRLKYKDIREVGFLVTKKVAGTFSLSVFTLLFLNDATQLIVNKSSNLIKI
jgi:hypothetical protein